MLTSPVSAALDSAAIHERAARVIPGGVSSANRLITEPNLVFIGAQGAYLYDAEGRRYIDYHAAFGPPVLGHCHPELLEQVYATLAQIDLVGVGASPLEAELAERIAAHVPSAERVLFANSGSEATYAALRLARAVTGRRTIVKFQGCYHGWHDAVLMNVISPPEKVGRADPLSAGMTPELVRDTLVLPFNDSAALAELFQAQGDQIAAVILEPIPHNIGCVLPNHAFLQRLRELTTRSGTVLIFDEVITGFRHALGGYQALAGITPDLTTLGKAIANGYPLAALCGRADLLDHCRPGGEVFFAGTYNAHPVGLAAALATLTILERPESYRHLFTLGERMREGLRTLITRHGITATVAGFGSVFVTYFMDGPIERYDDLLRNDAERFVDYRRRLIEHGVYELPVNLKRNHISLAHSAEDIDASLAVADEAFAWLRDRQ